ncbi:MAG: hypothetical protein LDL41_10745 [Coleofasciculus sp. S288]|nr:hypothetical protein [Coleofasciculus sp. S288]
MTDKGQEPIQVEQLETNPLFPSGEWEGFYTYAFGPDVRRYMMSFALTFKNGRVSGSGIDDIGRFIWHGSYDTEQLRCWLQKRYLTHSVSYDGYVDENGIWGSWEIPPYSRGGFHIWPKGLSENVMLEDTETIPESVTFPELVNL